MKYYITNEFREKDRIIYDKNLSGACLDDLRLKRLKRMFIVEEDGKYYEFFSKCEMKHEKAPVIYQYLRFMGYNLIKRVPFLTSDWDFVYHEVSEEKFIDKVIPYFDDKEKIGDVIRDLNSEYLRKKEINDKLREEEHREYIEKLERQKEKREKETNKVKTYIKEFNH